jgi:hypothetical protein
MVKHRILVPIRKNGQYCRRKWRCIGWGSNEQGKLCRGSIRIGTLITVTELMILLSPAAQKNVLTIHMGDPSSRVVRQSQSKSRPRKLHIQCLCRYPEVIITHDTYVEGKVAYGGATDAD